MAHARRAIQKPIWPGVTRNSDTLDSLTNEYERWLAEQSLPSLSADDLICQLSQRSARLCKPQISYLRRFIERWLTVVDAGCVDF